MGNQGIEVVLNTSTNRCLLLLLQRQGVVVTQKEFFKVVWGNRGQYITANTLYQNISLLRKALKTTGVERDIIQTIPKEGVCFSGKVTQLEDNDESDNKISTDILEEKENNNINDNLFSIPSSFKIKNIIVLVLSFIFIYFSYMFYINRLNYSNYFYEYKEIGVINQCKIFSKNSGILKLNDEYIDFVKGKNINCTDGQAVYISANNEKSRVFIQICDGSIINTTSCIVHIYIESTK
ncbi:Transcriptional regulatory protein, C terminal [Leminorella richardii]|uniref:Transcriptional regulatory protein, C terminal n=2 Tax=Leminorella richardii TaxID=158841 RepID=A0A2X4U555_9GAMM|nr:Transcriptional regulatory protein, C terminal [Leminorella richardii]